MSIFRDVYYEVKWMIEEVGILIKHPSRKASWQDLKYHFSKLGDHIIFHPWYCLKRGLRNVWVWFPTIWGNDSWDWFFLADMMDKQLGEMEKLWETKYVIQEREYDDMELGFRCQHRRIWKRIRWTRKLMVMWRDEHYAMIAYDEHHKAFPNRDNLFKDSTVSKVDEFGIPVLYECKPMTDDERVDYSSRSELARVKDEKVFKLWQKNLGFIRNWWH